MIQEWPTKAKPSFSWAAAPIHMDPVGKNIKDDIDKGGVFSASKAIQNQEGIQVGLMCTESSIDPVDLELWGSAAARESWRVLHIENLWY